MLSRYARPLRICSFFLLSAYSVFLRDLGRGRSASRTMTFWAAQLKIESTVEKKRNSFPNRKRRSSNTQATKSLFVDRARTPRFGRRYPKIILFGIRRLQSKVQLENAGRDREHVREEPTQYGNIFESSEILARVRMTEVQTVSRQMKSAKENNAYPQRAASA